ncbi:MAG: hypothetical protein F4124_09485 [Acidimicrobiia bacterium]|nr:hypothetical protein [Acidimicrobiia bacterium]MYB74590.1 hypothetical protein [Acidimicrobiia bacterium]MYH99646.1 hypothetical protein [Acidimicrobiia bacterium]
MTTLARRIGAIPLRTSYDTWQFITDLLSGAGQDLEPQFDEAADVASMLIAEEHTAENPIILSGCGPQVRIYTIHGTDAIDDSQLNEQPVAIIATSEWQLKLPATGSDYELASAAVAPLGNVSVYDPTGATVDARAGTRSESRQSVIVDLTPLEN